MKQKIRIAGMIRKADHFLVLKKNKGRADISTVWELPVCKIRVGEQPEEAIARLVDEDLSLTVKKMKIRDVITFTEYEDASKIYSLYIIYDIDVEDNEANKIELSDKYSSYKFLGFNDDIFSNLSFEEASATVLGDSDLCW